MLPPFPLVPVVPARSKVMESAALEAARSAGRPVGRPHPGSGSCAELPRASRRALRRHGSRAGALPKRHFDHAAAPCRVRVGCAAEGTRHATRPRLVRLGVGVGVRVRVRVRVRFGVGVGVRVRVKGSVSFRVRARVGLG